MVLRMAKRILPGLFLGLGSVSAGAATIGSLDGYRTYGDPINGSDYTGLRAGLEAEGHVFATETRDLTTSGYLDSVDAIFHGRPGASLSRTYPYTGELDALRQWVNDGGIFVLFGGNYRFASDLNRWSGAFGFSYVARDVSGGTWSSSGHELLNGVSGGSSLGAVSSSWVNVNSSHRDLDGALLDPDVFATISGDSAVQNAVIGARYGQGYVVFFGDENPVWGSAVNAGAITFLDNVLDQDLTAVPAPSLPLLMLIGLGLLGRVVSGRAEYGHISRYQVC